MLPGSEATDFFSSGSKGVLRGPSGVACVGSGDYTMEMVGEHISILPIEAV